MMSTLTETTRFPVRVDWMRFLWRAGLSLGLVLSASAVITLIAANWSHIDKAWRLGGVQLLIVLLIAMSVWLGKRNTAAWAHEYSPSVLLMAGAGSIVGGLFALLGQSYQTGADPWQLFALWAFVLIPWLWASRSLFLALLWMVLLNVSVALWMANYVGVEAFLRSYGAKDGWPVLLNVGLLLLAERAGPYFADGFRVLPRTAFVLTVYAVGAAVLAAAGEDNATFALTFLIAGVISGTALYWYLYRQNSFDLLMGCMAYALVFLLTIAVVGHAGLYDFDHLFLLIIFHSLTAIFIIRELSRRWRSSRTEKTSPTTQPWFLRLFRIAIVLFIGALLSFFLGAHLWSDSAYVAEILMALGFVLALILCRSNNSLLFQDMAAVALATGMVFGMVSHFSGDVDALRLQFFFYALIGVGLYVFSISWPMRFLSSFWTVIHLFAWVLTINSSGAWFDSDWSALRSAIEAYALVFMVLAFVLAGLAHQSKRYYEFFSPAMWVVFFASFVAISQLPSLLMVDDDSHWQIQWHMSSMLLMALPALALLFGLTRSQAITRRSVIAVVVVLVASIAWTGFPLLSLALAWGFLAFLWRNRALNVLAGLAVMVALNWLYYSLELSLNQKALMLGVTGLWLLVVVFLMAKSTALIPEADGSKATPVTARVPYRYCSVALGLFICLGVANADIWSKERILREGKRVVLELAPVDPRSLMQGDYMTLRYQVSDVVSQGLHDEMLALAQDQRHLWLWLEADDQTVAWKLRGIQTSSSSENIFWLAENSQEENAETSQWRLQKPDSVNLKNLVKVRVHHGNVGWTPGTNAWFFPEGQAELYENAKYGEFAVNSKGIALLRSLLNEQGHAIP